tara:strand:- start:248 stop:523 length:276 start_codon:yes stop_codon:yes gene_type:complete
MKRVYVIKSQDDGVIGVATNRKQAVDLILNYTNRYKWELLEDSKWLYSQINSQLRTKLTAFITVVFKSSYSERMVETEIEVEEVELNKLNM